MKVRELIALLDGADQNAPVFVALDSSADTPQELFRVASVSDADSAFYGNAVILDLEV